MHTKHRLCLPFLMVFGLKILFLLHLIFQSLMELNLRPKITLDSKVKLPNRFLCSSQCVCVLGRGNSCCFFVLCAEN